MQPLLCRCDDVGASIGGATERRRLAIVADLQRLQLTAILQPGRIVRQIAVDEAIRLGSGTQLHEPPGFRRDRRTARSGAADVLDDINIAIVIGMDALATAQTEKFAKR